MYNIILCPESKEDKLEVLKVNVHSATKEWYTRPNTAEKLKDENNWRTQAKQFTILARVTILRCAEKTRFGAYNITLQFNTALVFSG
jgi:hypothetical protein